MPASARPRDRRRRPARAARAARALVAVAVAGAACGSDPGGDPDPAPGFDGTTIRVGVLTARTGFAAPVGLPMLDGLQTWFAAHNAEAGGIGGRFPVEVVVLDTEFAGDLARDGVGALAGDVAILAQVFGASSVVAVLPDLAAAELLAVPAPGRGADRDRDELLPVELPAEALAAAAVARAAEVVGEGTHCVLAVDDPWGDAFVAGTSAALAPTGDEVAVVARYEAGSTAFADPVAALADAACDAVHAALVGGATAAATGAADQIDFAPRWMLAAPGWLPALVDTPLVDYLAASVEVVADGGAWPERSTPGGDALADRLDAHPPEVEVVGDRAFLAGYAHAQAVTALLEEAVDGGDLSPTGLRAARARLGEVELEGLGRRAWLGPPAAAPAGDAAASVFRVDPTAPGGLAPVP